jgi:hypothetical protein
LSSVNYTHYWFRRPLAEPASAFTRLCCDTEALVVAAARHSIGFTCTMPDAGTPIGGEAIVINSPGSAGKFLWPADVISDLSSEIDGLNDIPDPAASHPAWAGYRRQLLSDARAGREVFESVSTRYEPYDAVVAAVLIRAKVHYGDALRVCSDGHWAVEWAVGCCASLPGPSDLCVEVFGSAEDPFELGEDAGH